MGQHVINYSLEQFFAAKVSFDSYSYTGSFWNESKNAADYEIFEIFEVLPFSSIDIYSHSNKLPKVNLPGVEEDDPVYRLLLSKAKEIFVLTDLEIELIWNWNIGNVNDDGFTLEFGAEQYMFLSRPNYFGDESHEKDIGAFISLLNKVRKHDRFKQ